MAEELAKASAARTDGLIALLRQTEEGSLEEPSRLPGWSRLTIVCHLRYGARALLRMTRETLEGLETSYYPEGREHQRPGTLRPSAGEGPGDVLSDWERAAGELNREWSDLRAAQWGMEVVEPADNPDLGTVPLSRLALARLTEVDLHGTDLGLGAPDWSTTLVEVGLPARLQWLATRRANHRAFDGSLQGAWLFEAPTGLRWLISLNGHSVESRPAMDSESARAVIKGSARDLLALLVGRPPTQVLHFSGNVAFAQSFGMAFPGP